jgi:3-hydroxybutyryl-CoA dehydrogenase
MNRLMDGAKVAVVGGGRMGAQIATEYALAGYLVAVSNRTKASSDRAIDRSLRALDSLVNFGLAAAIDAQAAGDRLAAAADLAEACSAASLVVEAITEDFEAKVDVLSAASQLAPQAILATNTSSLRVGALAERSQSWERLVGTHYLNPPTLMPVVEVVTTSRTAPEVMEQVIDTLQYMDKVPVVVPDIPGFVWNRLQFALLREAVALHRRHGVTAEAIDLIMRKGLGRRWSIMGPFQTMALGGSTTFEAVAALLFPTLTCDLGPEEVGRVELPPMSDLTTLINDRDSALAGVLLAERVGQE